MKTALHPCFILHYRPYRETSLILDVFSLEYGRVSLIAKGVKGGRKGNTAHLLQPGKKLDIAWTMRSELGTMTAVEAGGFDSGLSGMRLVSCFYMNELLVRMLHKHEPHTDLFNIYEQSLVRLSTGALEARVLRIFEKHLLKSLGYGLVLDHEIVTGNAVTSEGCYFYQIDRGPLSERPVNAMNVSISGRTLRALENENDWDEDIARESKQLFRLILSEYTGDKPLGSRELYKAYLKTV